MSSTVDFADVARSLAAAGSTVHAAEAHGCLCGALCVRRGYGRAEWFDEILPDATVGEGSPLAQLGEATLAALAGDELAFQPLLPDDEQPLTDRVEALGAWCQGFLYGFGAAGTANRAALPADVTEVLGDFAQMSHAGGVGAEALEVEEEAYAELVEFLRVGVQLVFDELAALRAAQPAPRTDH